MRTCDLSDGSVKTLLILALLAANVVIALPHKREHEQAPIVQATRLASHSQPRINPEQR
jgi:hypothetical protein